MDDYTLLDLKHFILTNTHWRNIDPDLLLLAFSFTDYNLPEILRLKFLQKYGTINNSKFITVGGVILPLIIASLLIHQRYNVGEMTQITNNILQGKTLVQLMKQKNLCINYISNIRLDDEKCVKLFKAIIGVLYWDLIQRFSSYLNIIEYIKEWLITVWDFSNLVTEMIIVSPYVKQLIVPEEFF